MERKYDPTLIYALTVRHVEEKRVLDDVRSTPYPPEILIYVAGKSGAYYIMRGKLYWDETVGDGYWGNTDQDGLESDAANLREVVLHGAGHHRTDPVTFTTFEEFLTAIGFKE